MTTPRRATGLRTAGGLLLLLVWETAGRLSSSLLLPSCSETAVALVRLVRGPDLWLALWSSNQALLVGLVSAVAAGVPVGMALGRWPLAGRWLAPYVRLLLVIPTTALVPMLLIVGGVTFLTRAAVVSLFALPVIVECARVAVSQVPPGLADVACSLCATTGQQWRHVVWPASIPGILLGIRLGVSRAIEGMVIAELLLVAAGIGGLLLDYQGRFDAASVYAVMLVVIAEAAALTYAARRVERRVSARFSLP